MALPSNQDQLMLELINKARTNPQAEADRLLAGNLNEGLPDPDVPGSTTISTDPKQPLAWNEDLIAAAEGHTQAMFDDNAVVDDDFFAHVNPNVLESDDLYSPRTRATAAGYPATNSGVGENIGVVAQEPDPINLTEATPGRGHRVNILQANFKEIGNNNGLGTNYGAGGRFSGGEIYDHAAIATQDFGFVNGSNSFLTGVVYDDNSVTDDDFYTVGEGLGGITVQAVDSLEQTFETTTYGSGGYQLQLPADTYTVSFIGDLDGDGNNDTVAQEVVIGSENVKVDIECFLTGTRILTEKGEIAVENLAIGDRVQTADGKLESIKWIGKQTIRPNQVKNPLRGYPVLIKAGALGHNVPRRDLYTSPDHSLFVEV